MYIAIFISLFFALLTDSFAGESNILNDIANFKKVKINKETFESSSEFRNRANGLSNKFNARTYKHVIKINNNINDKDNIVSYDPDSEILTIKPYDYEEFENYSLTNSQLNNISYSYFFIGGKTNNKGSYIAKNGYGKKLKVTKLDMRSNYFAIVGTGNTNSYDSGYQKIEFKIKREKAKDILQKGKLVFELRANMQFLCPLENVCGLVYEKSNYIPPTIYNPREVTGLSTLLPVQLVEISLFDSKGKLIYSKDYTKSEASINQKKEPEAEQKD
jgi:hypothetical protein